MTSCHGMTKTESYIQASRNFSWTRTQSIDDRDIQSHGAPNEQNPLILQPKRPSLRGRHPRSRLPPRASILVLEYISRALKKAATSTPPSNTGSSKVNATAGISRTWPKRLSKNSSPHSPSLSSLTRWYPPTSGKQRRGEMAECVGEEGLEYKLFFRSILADTLEGLLSCQRLPPGPRRHLPDSSFVFRRSIPENQHFWGIVEEIGQRSPMQREKPNELRFKDLYN